MNAVELPVELLSGAFDLLHRQLTDWGYNCSIFVKAIDKGWWIGIRTNRENIPRKSTYIDINILEDVFYLLHIELKKEDRGKGYGSQLYELLVDAARSLGCRRIEQTPSGWTPSREERASYLSRRGWLIAPVKEGGLIAYKDLNL